MFCRRLPREISNILNVKTAKILPIIQQKLPYSLYEPYYLEYMKSKIPLYNTINIQIKGYDFPVLESYQKLINTIAENMNIEVEECWAVPPQQFHIQRYKPKSSIIDGEYDLKIYERNIQIVDINATLYPILLRVLEASLPEGVTLRLHEHQQEHEELRYVPDKQLIELKTQLDGIIEDRKK